MPSVKSKLSNLIRVIYSEDELPSEPDMSFIYVTLLRIVRAHSIISDFTGLSEGSISIHFGI